MFRPSTLIRILEDSVVAAGSAVGRKAQHFAHETSIEVRARQIARETRRTAKAEAEASKLSAAERRQLERDQRTIERRAHELLGTKPTVRRRKSSKRRAK